VEDKLPIANDLCIKLEEAGLCIWYSGRELKAGDSVERTILKALDESEYGIVILSPTYVERNWPMKEYYLLLAKEIEQRKVILPVLYNISVDELLKYDIAIADRWGIGYHKGMDHVVEKLLEVIKGPANPRANIDRSTWRKILGGLGVILVALGFYIGYQTYFNYPGPSDQVVEKAIIQRINELDFDIDKNHRESLSTFNAKPATIDDVKKVFSNYVSVKTNYRNTYFLDNGFKTIQSRTNVETALKCDLDSLAPAYSYNLSSPNIFLSAEVDKGSAMEARYILLNTQPLTFDIRDTKILDSGDYEVSVSYKNNLRYILVELLLPQGQNQVKRHYVKLKGYLPLEKYVFEEKSDGWRLKDVR
jgi:hypothetical protein